MSGNVSEWCNDFYANNYYINSPDTNPTGPDSGYCRVKRGGSFEHDALACRSVSRNYAEPYKRTSTLGFRLVHPK